jgi:hypothetical protein
MAIVKISDLPLVDQPVEGTDLFVVVQDNVTKKAYASDIQTYVGFEEVQYATAGQTVFNLTTMTYAAGANNLQVFVDGVNQYEGLAYTETDNNTVTFTQGLHQGAVVKFSTVQTQTSSVTSAGAVSFLQAGTGAVSTNVQTRLRETVSVKDFGAVGDGVTDDTAAIQAAINFSKSVPVFNNGNNSTPRGGVAIRFPAGIYVIASTLTLNNINGIKFVGDGKETSMLVHTANSGAMFDCNQMIWTTFENLGFAAGTVTVNIYGNKSINIRSTGNRTTNLFKWTTDAGGDRYNCWREIVVKGGFAKAWDVGGTNTHSENTILASTFEGCDYVWYSDNAQSMNTYFIGCDAEFIAESVFYFLAGGFLTVIGGSYINPKDTLTLAGTNAGIGSSNGHFIFRDVKWEMYQDIDPATSPKMLNSTSTAYAQVTFENCSNNAGLPDPAKTFISVVSSLRISVEKCDFVGVIATTPTSGKLGFLSFRDCRMLPTVTRNASGGAKFKVFYENCGDLDGPILNNANVDDDNTRVISYNKNAIRLKAYQTISTASTAALTFSIPSNVIFNQAVVTVVKAGGVTLDVNAYMNAGKTVTLFTVSTGTTVTHRIWNPAISYSGANVSDYVSGNTLYVDLVSGGNAGLVQVVITLEYVSHG